MISTTYHSVEPGARALAAEPAICAPSLQVPNCSRVLDLVLNRKGSLLLATCQDQRVRMYDVAAAPAGGVAGGVEPPSDAQLAEALASKVRRRMWGHVLLCSGCGVHFMDGKPW